MREPYASNSLFLDRFSERYPYRAEAPISVRSERVDVRRYGDFASSVLSSGVRTYAFRSETGRDLFKKDYER